MNPLPASIEVRLKEGTATPPRSSGWPSGSAASASWTTCASGGSGCRSSTTSATSPGVVGLVIGLAFAGVAVVIIGVTIRLTLLQRAREIAIMRLVGATNWFIRGPFLLEGALKGLLGGLLSARAVLRRVSPLPRPAAAGPSPELIFFRPEHMVVDRAVRRPARAGAGAW